MNAAPGVARVPPPQERLLAGIGDADNLVDSTVLAGTGLVHPLGYDAHAFC